MNNPQTPLPNYDVAILGGGISGLTAAWYLSKQAPEKTVLLLEKSNRLGGYIRTVYRDSFLLELGPRTFRTAHSPALLELIDQAGLSHDLLFAPLAKRFLWRGAKLSSMSRLLAPHFWRFLKEPWIPVGKKEETVFEFLSRRLGKKVAQVMGDALALGVFAGDPHTLSMQAAFPSMVAWEKTYGSISKGMRKEAKVDLPLFTLRSGMQTLVDTLAKKIPTDLLLEKEVLRVTTADDGWKIFTNTEIIHAETLFVALPTGTLEIAPKVPEEPIVAVAMGFDKDLQIPQGYGYLIARQEKEALLGVIWDSSIFPSQDGGVRMTALVKGGSEDPVEIAKKGLKKHLKISANPQVIEVQYGKIPQYVLGHAEQLVSKIQPKNFFILGNYLTGPSVNACIARAKEAVNTYTDRDRDSRSGNGSGEFLYCSTEAEKH